MRLPVRWLHGFVLIPLVVFFVLVEAGCVDWRTKSPHEWRLNLYPDAREFAFTIVHDADSAYSRRLAPLFEEFDTLHMKITPTVFAFWASWADKGAIWATWKGIADPDKAFAAPKAVPLTDKLEQEFYLQLAARGHEVGMHTPSETSDTTEEVSQAFDYFKQVFGHPPTVYVEHSKTFNKETQENEGGNPHSMYYSKEILNRFAPWVWIDGPQGLPSPDQELYFDLRAVGGAPFTRNAADRYGIAKVFMRTGRWQNSDGDGFLQWYTKANIDTLQRNRGVALVYTHLDSKWLDLSTRRMREPIRERLRYLVSKNGWFAPAGTILDRIEAMASVTLAKEGEWLRIRNRDAATVEMVTVISPDGRSLCKSNETLRPRPTGDIVVGAIGPGQALAFQICR